MADLANDKDFPLQQAAYLFAEKGLSQQEVAERLGISQGHVSRVLKQAEDRGWLVRTVRFASGRISKERLEMIRGAVWPTELEKKLHALFPNLLGVEVFWNEGNESASREKTGYDAVDRSVGQWLCGKLAESRISGVGWGTTLSRVILAMNELGWKSREPAQFLPLCGEPDNVSVSDVLVYSSSGLAAQLDRIANGCETQSLAKSLAGVPAVVPADLEPRKQKVIREYIEAMPAYQSVLGPSGLIHKADTIITSIGINDMPRSSLAKAFFNSLITKDVYGLIVGDICGVLLPKANLDSVETRRFREVVSLWMGVQREHLLRVANEARTQSRPGVIVVARRALKAHAVLEVVRSGLANYLLIDQELAQALQALVEKEEL